MLDKTYNFQQSNQQSKLSRTCRILEQAYLTCFLLIVNGGEIRTALGSNNKKNSNIPLVSDSCLKDEDSHNRLLSLQVDAQNIFGVESTPTFLINGEKVQGNRQASEFIKIIKKKLNN